MTSRAGTPRFGTDGLRGVANRELTPELALALGRAAARRLGAGAVLLGRDTRRSGTMLAAALAAGLASEGAIVIDVGVIPTPGIAFLAASRALPAAMISASHNPFADNGIKLLAAGGTKLPDHLERAIEEELDALVAHRGASDRRGPGDVGEVRADPGAAEQYVAHLAGLVDLAGVRVRVLLDCANGAASAVAPAVLTRLGVDAVVLAADPDGTNINAGCGSTHAGALGASVRAAGVGCGLAFDGDADRLIALDETGAIVDGDALLALFAIDLHERGELEGGAVVATVMSNLGLRRTLERRGIALIETPVGDRHVADALEAGGLVLGGEQSGHLIFRRDATTGDGILTAVKLLELLVRRDEPLSRLAAVLERLPQRLATIAVNEPRRLSEADEVWAEVAAVEAELQGAGRVLLRASGTEAAVRVMVEAETDAAVDAAVRRLSFAVARALGAPGADAGRA